MRDPDLVQRAERAAAALEKAWIHWRVRHGLGTGQLPPVSSYVGYSLTEPWGQPRVVFGVDADEAERLAAILEGHDCVGPVHAGVTSRPERWQQAEAGPRGGQAGAVAQGQQPAPALAVPSQPAPDTQADARQSEPGLTQPGEPSQPARTQPPGGGAASQQSAQVQFAAAPVAQTSAADPATRGPAESAAEDLTAEQPILPLALRQAAALASPPAQLPAEAVAYLQELATRSAAGAPLPSPLPAAPVLPATPLMPAAPVLPATPVMPATPVTPARPAVTAVPPPDGSLAAGSPDQPAGQPGIVPLRPRPAPAPGQAEVSHVPGSLAGSPGAHPWWPGMADDEQAGPATDDRPDPQGEDQIARARLMPVSKLNRTRQQPADAPKTTDTAV
jgi:hypothetical protein